MKNAALAKEAVALLKDVRLLELKGYNRDDVANIFYAADALLMTSHTEGSPQVIKEAMACGCPIVSVDVGDVAGMVRGVEYCYIVERKAQDISMKLREALMFQERTFGRRKIMDIGLTNDKVASHVIDIYLGLE